MYIFKNWYVDMRVDACENHYFIGHGNVYDNPKFVDGLRIHTSEIEQVSVDGNAFILKTQNSEYKVEFNSYKMYHKAELINFLKKFHLGQYYKTIINQTGKSNNKKFREIKDSISEGEFYLNVSGVNPEVSYFKTEGRLYLIQPYIHVGMFKDSVLYTLCDKVDLRYFPMGNGIEFYHISDNIKNIKIFNSGYDIFYLNRRDEESIEIKNGETLDLTREEFEYIEGLISPDFYNGKSVLSNIKEIED